MAHDDQPQDFSADDLAMVPDGDVETGKPGTETSDATAEQGKADAPPGKQERAEPRRRAGR